MESPAAPGAPLAEGHYTVVLAGGDRRTLRVSAAGPLFRAGPLIVSYLCGPDNERDYQAFAHLTTDGAPRLWIRFRHDTVLAKALRVLVADEPDVDGSYRARSLRCTRCRRPLTHPDSIERGMGPRCARQLIVERVGLP
jgi:hypothetical protein